MRGFKILLSATVFLTGSMIIVQPAQATITAGSVTVESGVAATSDLQLLGVSDTGVNATAYAVARNGNRVVATTTNDTLVDYDTPYDTSTALVSDLTGGILRWAEPKGSAWVIHREPVFGGGRVDYDSTDRPYAFTPDSWIGFKSGTLTKHVFGGGTTTLATGLTSVSSVQADDKGALVLYGVTVSGQVRTRVGLITFGKAGIEKLAEDTNSESGQLPAEIALTPNSVVWYSQAVPILIFGNVHRRARAGGAVSTVGVPVANRTNVQLAATDTEAAVTRLSASGGNFSTRLYVLKGTAWREIAVPGSAPSSLRASASTIAFTVGGDDITTAGVYKTSTGTAPVLVARPSLDSGLVTDVDLQAGRLTYGLTVGGAPASYLRRATVATSGTLTAGAPVALPDGGTRLAHTRGVMQTAALSVWGDRTAARTGSGVVLLTDAGVKTGPTPALSATERPVKRSGSYLLVDQKVYRGDDLAPVADLTSRNCTDADLYGSFVFCHQPDGKNVFIDVEGRFPTSVTGNGTGEVAIHGTWIAWIDNATLKVQDFNVVGPIRSLGLPSGAHDLALSEGVVSWTNNSGNVLAADIMNLTAGAGATGLTAPASVDDHLVAGVSPGGALQVRTLPFGIATKYRPRLVDALTPVSFNATSTTWKPVFDTTKPLVNAKVVIKSGATVVATLTGTGTTSTVRDLAWNGKTTGGANAPAGAYTWTFTADARDGDGSVTNIDGSSAVTGTVYLTR